jgi:uncharacterized Tic20 family protein
MSFSTLKIPLPIVLFCVGIFPCVLAVIADYFELLDLHGDPVAILLLIAVLIVPPVCFVIGFFQSFRFTGKHRRIGLTLNGLGLTILLFWVFGGFN